MYYFFVIIFKYGIENWNIEIENIFILFLKKILVFCLEGINMDFFVLK